MGDGADGINPESGDTLARCVLHPRQISQKSGVFAFEDAFNLVKSSKAKICPAAMSVGLVRAIGEEAQIHLYGCRSAEHSRQARKLRLELTEKVDPNPRLPHYIGYYTFVLDHIVNIDLVDATVEIVQHTENGETAHCNVILTPAEGADAGKWSDARTAFYNAMSNIVTGPKRHVCEIDRDLGAQLDRVDLPECSVPSDAG